MLLPKAAASVLGAVSKDIHRSALTGVHVTKDYVETCDGTFLLRYTPADKRADDDFPTPTPGEPDAKELDETGVIVRAAAFAAASKSVAGKRATYEVLQNFQLRPNCTGATFRATKDLDTWHDTTSTYIAGPWPDVSSVWPKDKPSMIIGFNARKLLAIAKAAIEASENAELPVLKLSIHTPETAATFECENLTGLLMPVR